ncbi:rhomboid family intramembrane serine protease [Natronolimnohabitans innermongolicus]|uniref:Rhomboid family protein n=1 Tax=Natronolimnohabitans innermongolicus JCM 12255 TaxID=1227499 RepID=L9WWR7_9EURY|nr:rhomboid family intramembrane serine protease [Natronolimnohabitans innermongolicus]ELY52783.1 rhomboid family protein [Natronolimnohabitans innermongolicus JCM 12255]
MVNGSSRSGYGSQPRAGTGGGSRSGRGSTPSDEGSSGPVFELLVVFVAVFVVQGVTEILGIMVGLFVLAPPLTTNPWTIISSVYAHGGLGHLVSNSLALIIFGWPVARATTRLRFHTFFAVTGAVAGVSQIVLTDVAASLPFIAVTPTEGVIGASGAVFALFGYLVASNRLSASLASFVDVPRWLSILVFLGLATAVTIATGAPGVALLAHFTGFFVGLLAGRARVLHVGSQTGSKRSV